MNVRNDVTHPQREGMYDFVTIVHKGDKKYQNISDGILNNHWNFFLLLYQCVKNIKKLSKVQVV